MLVVAGPAHVDMAAECSSAAKLDGGEHSTLSERQLLFRLEYSAVQPRDPSNIEAWPAGGRRTAHWRLPYLWQSIEWATRVGVLPGKPGGERSANFSADRRLARPLSVGPST